MAVEKGDAGLGQVSGAQAEHPGHRVDAEHHLLCGVGAQLIEPGNGKNCPASFKFIKT